MTQDPRQPGPGQPPQGRPPQGQPPGQGRPPQGQPPGQGRPPGPPPGQGQPMQGPPQQGRPMQGPPPGQGQPPIRPMQGPPPGQPPQSGQPMQGQGAPAGGGAPAQVIGRNEKPSLVKMFMPEPSKAPPLEWVALVVGLVLAITAFLPWVVGSDNFSYSGIDSDSTAGFGWATLGAGLASVVMGFVGLSRDSIALAAGQAIIGIITLVLALLSLNPGEGNSPGFGVYLALVASVLLIGLSAYNAYDAYKKGAKY